MKTTSHPYFFRPWLIVSLLALAHGALHAADDNTATAKLSAPDKPATLRIDLPWADIHVTGVDGDTVTVASTLKEHGSEDSRNDGLRRLDEESNFILNEKGNIVSLTLAGDNPAAGGNNAEFKISMPRSMALDVRTDFGGDLRVNGLAGDIEINNTNGEVLLDGISGSAVVNTMNGEVRASYAQPPQKLIAITSMNGEINLQLPVETKANVQLRTHNGSILTDFDKTRLKTKSEGKSGNDVARVTAMADEIRAHRAQIQAMRADADSDAGPVSPAVPAVPRPPRPPLPPVIGGKLISGTLNGGGVDINISTMNGKITLRQTNKTTAAPATGAQSPAKENVTVIFQDPDKFTDAGDRQSSFTSTDTLDALRAYVQQTAAPLVAPGNKLTVTFLDIDLAGLIRPDKDNIRVLTDVTPPRVELRFQLVNADGQVLKKGERRLTDMNYLQSGELFGRNDPFYHDKQLLKDWLTKEFKTSR